MPNPPKDKPAAPPDAALKMREASRSGLCVIDGFRPGAFLIAGQAQPGPRLIWGGGHAPWPVTDWAAITAACFDALPFDRLDLLLVGGGDRLRPLPKPAIAGLRAKGLALEWMDSGAAARTYNLLLVEGRAVAAALWPR